MTRRSNVWLVVAVLFSVLNVGGAGQAAVAREPLHAGVHVALALLGAYFVWRLAPGRPTRPLSGDLGDRMTRLEQSVDAVALEVERIGEGQRFMTRLFTENGTARAAGEGAAAPSERDPREGAP